MSNIIVRLFLLCVHFYKYNASRIVSVGAKPKIEIIETDFQTIYEEDNNRLLGEEYVKRDGKKGQQSVTTRYTVNAQTGEVETVEEQPMTINLPIDKIVVKGTRVDKHSGSSVTHEEKPEIPVESKKGDALIQDEKPVLTIAMKNGGGSTQLEKPESIIEDKEVPGAIDNGSRKEEKPALTDATNKPTEESQKDSISYLKDNRLEKLNNKGDFHTVSAPQTGDVSSAGVHTAWLALSGGVLFALRGFKRRKKTEEE